MVKLVALRGEDRIGAGMPHQGRRLEAQRIVCPKRVRRCWIRQRLLSFGHTPKRLRSNGRCETVISNRHAVSL